MKRIKSLYFRIEDKQYELRISIANPLSIIDPFVYSLWEVTNEKPELVTFDLDIHFYTFKRLTKEIIEEITESFKKILTVKKPIIRQSLIHTVERYPLKK